MFEPVRGGTRGGQAEFKWSDVSADKDRENYLGHSINAPTGRWQKNKDIHWYNRDIDTSAAERAEEIKKIKDLEADALAVALGFEPASKTGGKTTGANSIPVASSSNGESQAKADKEEKRRRKEERRAEKRARKELKKLSQTGAHGVHELAEKPERPRRHPSRSRSPRFRSKERRPDGRRLRSRSRSRTPRSDPRNAAKIDRIDSGYDSGDRERERERDRQRWDSSTRRDLPQGQRRY